LKEREGEKKNNFVRVKYSTKKKKFKKKKFKKKLKKKKVGSHDMKCVMNH
jgi:hypothetical protein